jgi:hypothetical protein
MSLRYEKEVGQPEIQAEESENFQRVQSVVPIY